MGYPNDCTNCWNSPCTCGQRRMILPGGVIDPDADYDGKGTKNDPLKGRHKELKGYVKKHEKIAEMQKKKAIITRSMPEPLKSFHIQNGDNGLTPTDLEGMKATMTMEEYTKAKENINKRRKH